MLRVLTLGRAVIETSDRSLLPSSEVMFGLALFLSVNAGREVPRGDLAAMFWPDSSDAAGRHNLRQILYRLRRAGFPLFESPEVVSVDPASVICDVSAVLSPSWPATVSKADLAAIGEFLPGVRASAPNGYSTWLDGLRERVSTQVRLGALHQLSLARSDGRWSELDTWAQIILRSDPLSEEATLARAESAAMAGSKAVALEILDRFIEELGDHRRSVALPATTLRRRISERLSDWGGRAPSDVALVGRTQQMRQLTELIDTARRGQGGALLVHGAPGIGKTRLCTETRAYATLHGFRGLAVRADGATRGRPLAITYRVARLIYDLPGVAACTPTAMSVIRRLLDESDASALSHALAFGHTTLAQISWALSEAILAASHEGAVCLHIDDLHNADRDSITILHAVACSLASSRVALLATARSHLLVEDESGATIWKDIPRLHVPPLSTNDSRALALAVSETVSNAAPGFDASEVVAGAGGNPLFLCELSTHRALGQSSGNPPTTLARLIAERIALLSPTELRLLRLATLLGEFATVPRLFDVVGDQRRTLSADLEILEADGLLQLEDSGALVIHECWSDVVQSGIPRATRATLALECASSLSRETAGMLPLELLWHSAHLFSLAGDHARAVTAYSEAGDRMLSRGVPTQAAEAFSQAVANSRDGSEAARQSVLLAMAHHAASDHFETIAVCRRALDALTDNSEHGVNQRAALLALLADSGWKATNEFKAPLNALAELLTSATLEPQQRNLCCLIGIRIAYADDGRLAPFFATQTVTGERPLLEEWVGFTTQLIFEAESGSAERVRELTALLGDRSLDQLPLHSRLLLLRHRSVALRFVGAMDDAIALSAEAASLAADAGALPDAVAASLTLTFALLDDGRIEEAARWVGKAADLSKGISFDERQRSLRHAMARYQLAAGNATESLRVYRPHIEEVLCDEMQNRRLVELACIAHASAIAGASETAARIIAEAAPLLRSLTPSLQLDFAADAVVAALAISGREREGSELRADYLWRRERRWNRPIARAFTRLTTELSQPRTE